ncbi:MAG: ATP-binding protein [Candidatus Saccharibacteria bacterium]|nr:ATP-binding protein [Candidatus Saccharibacteria bacterium]
MAQFLGILFIVLPLIGAGGFLFYKLYYQKLMREQKNFERGLKMVPLLIHLPPMSDDTDENGRDVRDLIDENVSKSQVLYSIIASTLTKGFKSRFYGQRHFGFEIIASKGFVHYYASVPVALVDVVKQAVISAYPSSQLEEVAEHNIFSPVGKISATMGGELSLKENYAYPIATYQELKRDAMQSILNALSTLDKEDGAGIQILMRPANPDWRKTASAVASKKRKGEKDSKGPANEIWHFVKQIPIAFAKPPEGKGGGGDEKKKELSGLEQAVLDSIDDKTRYPGYEVLIRLVASSNVSQRAQTIMNNMRAAFSLFDAQGKNGFKFTAAADMESFVTAFILRFFPQENNKSILNSVELATLFHFPDQKNIPTSQLSRQASKQVDGPRNMPDEGLLLGYNVFRGAKKPIRLSQEDRRRHMYVVGQTGVGKSIFLENLALQDMLEGRGFAFVDPHGDTVDRLVSMVPRERTEDVIYFSPDDMEYPMGLNLFEFHTPEQKDFLIQEAINMLYKLYDPQHQGIIGPRYENWFRNIALTVMAQPGGGTFIDIPTILNNYKNKAYLAEKLSYVTDPTVKDFWYGEIAQTSDYHISEVLGWFVSKFGAFRSNEMMRNIIGQTKSAFNLREVMDSGKLLFVNLSKGRTGELNSTLLGMIFVMKFQAAAMSRATIPEHERRDFCLYVDEFQNFSTDSFATILSEARKYHLNLVVANQFTTQLTDEIRDAVFGNVGSIASFRVGADADADALSKKFQPIFEREDVLRLPNYNTIMQMLIGGIPTQPFSMATIPPLGTPNEQLGIALKQLSAAKYGRPKSIVEKEIGERIATKEMPPAVPGAQGAGQLPAGGPNRAPAAPGASPYGALPAGMPPQPPARTGTGNFLDEWLAKKQTAPVGAMRPANPYAAPGATMPMTQPGMMPMTPGAPMPQAMPMQPRPMAPAGMPPQMPYGPVATPAYPPLAMQPLPTGPVNAAGNAVPNNAVGMTGQTFMPDRPAPTQPAAEPTTAPPLDAAEQAKTEETKESSDMPLIKKHAKPSTKLGDAAAENPKDKPAETDPPKEEPKPNEPATEKAAPKPEAGKGPDSLSVHLGNTDLPEKTAEEGEDTISIDSEGTLHVRAHHDDAKEA